MSSDVAARPRIYLNGKFYASPINGVCRVSDRLIRELDLLAEEGAAPSAWDMRLLVPERTNWAPEFRHIVKMPQKRGHTQFWEQALLPFAARDGLLVCLANLAPGLHRRKITMVHDVQFLISPRSYPLKLRLGYRVLIPIGSRTSRLVLTVSHYARESLKTFGYARAERIRVAHNAAEHLQQVPPGEDVLERLNVQPRAYCLVFGSVAAYKNVDVVFAAFGMQALAGLKLVVIGPDAAQLRAGGLVPAGDAVFAGGVDDATLRALYENALCLLFPSLTEGFGLPPLEAMTCGCPVIAAPAGAMPEICRDAVLYADPPDPGSWATEIARLAADPLLREAKIRAGLARAADFSWRKSALHLVDAISDVLKR